eukprot:CAMPEP_0119302044 /NCGR_PEP_ID=MMETSP1333-20130426/3718_1 /TAXON_ID=418940 /ORGANISM="Scyphosphaera apsteinii, Strain RCC1455" /LENGTH=491 /DNA_ID=CAMNT_0007304279 /DNA_START=109 /DNA_END=1584 /DNA_ORIENTATION=+
MTLCPPVLTASHMSSRCAQPVSVLDADKSLETYARQRRPMPAMVPSSDRAASEDGWVCGPLSIEPVLRALQNGEFVLLAEDDNEDTAISLILLPQHATAEKLRFLAEHAVRPRLVLQPERYARVYNSLHAIVLDNKDLDQPAISISIQTSRPEPSDAAHVSATLRALASEEPEFTQLQCPGAVSLSCARSGGLLRRAGATEAAAELSELCSRSTALQGPPHCDAQPGNNRAGNTGLGALQATLRKSGWGSVKAMSATHGLRYTSTADLVAYLRRTQQLVERVGLPARMPTKHGLFMAHCFRSLVDGVEHIALVKSATADDEPMPFAAASRPALVRVHSECCTGDIFGSLRCDCGPQLEKALQEIELDGHGVLLYLRGQEGRGIGLGAKIHAYRLQERGFDTLDANKQLGLPVDTREYGTGAQILVSLGIRDIRLISNNPKKFSGLTGYGLRIVERVASATIPNPENIRYLRTKQDRMGHMLGETILPDWQL